MKKGMVAIGMIVLIAASAVVMSASAENEEGNSGPKVQINQDVASFIGFEDGDKIGVAYVLNGTSNTWEWHYRDVSTYTNRNVYRFQFVGETPDNTKAIDEFIVLDPGTYKIWAKGISIEAFSTITIDPIE